MSQQQPPQQPNKPQQLTKMDERCPRKLEHLADQYCPLAVQRLKALRHAGRELTEEEANKLPGCPWAVNHQLANYCFFNFVSQYVNPDKPLSDMEIAHLLSISTESVKKIEKKALNKMRENEVFKEIIDIHDGDQIMADVDNRDGDAEYQIIK